YGPYHHADRMLRQSNPRKHRLEADAGEESKPSGQDRFPEMRNAPLDRPQSDRAIAGNNRSVRATIELNAESPFGAGNQRLSLEPAHRRQIENVQVALSTKPYAF